MQKIARKIRSSQFSRFSIAVSEEMNQLFFHGLRLWRYIDSDAFVRFQAWADSEFTYELAVLAMITLKCNKTAVLYRGDWYAKNGEFKAHYSWVECKIPGYGWCVVDFVHEGAFFEKHEYMTEFDGSLVPKWSCSYDEFWGMSLTQKIYSAAKSQNHSHLLLELTNFASPDPSIYEFPTRCYLTEAGLRYSDGRFMPPFVSRSGKEMSSAIIRDFVKKEGRKQPRARSIRLTHLGVLEYQKWCARHAVQPA